MSPTDKNLSETDIRSPNSHQCTVRGEGGDDRPWLRSAPLCAQLGSRGVLHLGVATMPAPFEIVRTQLGGSYFLASFAGCGRVLVDGRWKPCNAGDAFLLPPGTLHAFGTESGGTWSFCWVRYRDGIGPPAAASGPPVVAPFDPEPLRHAILGLYSECAHAHDEGAVTRWVELTEHYVYRFAHPTTLDPRLARLWQEVAERIAEAWTAREMAETAGLSEKHLERLCKQQLGRTPRQQLIWLRMRRASELLVDRERTIESIAAAVGYRNPFVFSTTFRRIMGWPPSRYPRRVSAV